MATGDRYKKWYNPDQPDELHRDLQADYPRTKAELSKRPSLVRHFEECEACAEIRRAHSVGPDRWPARKRIKLVINTDQMHQLLGLPAHHEIVFMYAYPDPNTVQVIVAGEDLPHVSATDETPPAGWLTEVA